MAYTYETLAIETTDRIATVTLNRPDQLNAFTVTMANELEDFFQRVNDDDDIGIVIVTGAGRAFCAGMDLRGAGNVFGLDERLQPSMSDMHDRLHEPEIEGGVRDTGGRVTLAIHACLKPVIAAINGDAVGIGATMTLAMDFRLISKRARIGFVFARIGVVPEACSSWFLPRIVGQQRALEWTLTGDLLSAETALAGGLVRSSHDDDADLLTEARALAARIVRDRSPVAIALTRRMMRQNAAFPHPIDAHRIDSLAMFYASIGDGKEGVAAFLEKRAPHFAGKASNMPAPFRNI